MNLAFLAQGLLMFAVYMGVALRNDSGGISMGGIIFLKSFPWNHFLAGGS